MPRKSSGDDQLAKRVTATAKRLVRKRIQNATSESEAVQITEDTVHEVFDEAWTAIARSGPASADAIDARMASLLRRQRRGQRGFQRRLRALWQEGLDRLEVLIGYYREIGEHFFRDGVARGVAHTALFRAQIELHARGARVGSEILTLVQAGFADGAHARWRTLYEISVVCRFLAMHGEDIATRYLQHQTVRGAKAARAFNQHASAIGWDPAPVEVLESLARQAQPLLDRHGKAFETDYGWAAPVLAPRSLTFRSLTEAVGWGHWAPFYTWASGGVHAGADGLRPMGADGHGRDYVLVGASNRGLMDAAQFTALTLAQLLRSLNMPERRMDHETHIVTFDALTSRCQDALRASHLDVETGSARGAPNDS